MELRYWGLTDNDADKAKDDALYKISLLLGESGSAITRETRNVGGRCPIQRNDGRATYQDATYNASWAVYSNPDDVQPEVSGSRD